MYSNNVDFTGGATVEGRVTSNGQLLIGSTVSPNIRVGTLTSTGGTVTITGGAGTINLEAAGSIEFVTDSGSANPAAGSLNVVGGTSIDTSGAGSTVTITFDQIIPNANGIDYNPGGDIDADVVTVGVTGAPRIFWDESEDSFSNTNGLIVTGLFNQGAGQIVKVTTPGAYPYTTLSADYVIKVDTSSARGITLIGSPATGRTFRIKDTVGSAGTNNITITPAAGNIDGAGTYVINVNYGSVDLVYTGSEWSVL